MKRESHASIASLAAGYLRISHKIHNTVLTYWVLYLALQFKMTFIASQVQLTPR